MSEPSTVLVLGRRRSDNMPSLTRMLEVLKPITEPAARSGMDATVVTAESVRITGRAPIVMGPHDDCCGCGCEGCNDGDLEDD